MDPVQWRLRYASSDFDDPANSTTPICTSLNPQQISFINHNLQNFISIQLAWANGTQLPCISPSTNSINQQTIEYNQFNSNKSNNNMTNPDTLNMNEYSTGDDTSDSTNEYNDGPDHINVNKIIECLRTNQPFRHRIRLSNMVDILTVIWEDELD